MNYNKFVFDSYAWDAEAKTLSLHYVLDDLKFLETYRFDFDFVPNIDTPALSRAFELLFLVAGVSYYKTFLPPEIEAPNAQIDNKLAKFMDNTYQKGLGEFFYINNLDPNTPIRFPINVDEIKQIPSTNNEGLLIGIGGGKDSLVSLEFLQDQPKVATWSLNHYAQIKPLIDQTSLQHFQVDRQWDKQILNLNQSGAYNGHVPISAILACVGTIVAILTGYRDVVVSNESSASDPTLNYKGVEINHQYSKSLEFEQDFQDILQHLVGSTARYYSFLRPLSDLYIAELFAATGFDKYAGVFSSCNKAYVHDSNHMFWDGTCPKCAFVFLALTPFVEQPKLEKLFGGKNLLQDHSLAPTYKQLLGIEGDKPMECVGAVKECRAAMRLAQQKYPELAKCQFDLPKSYNYQTLSPHSMPPEIHQLLLKNLPKQG